MYNLHTAWMRSQELARLDAFQARCLRRILGVPHSFISRVTNKSILERAGCRKLSSILLQRQLCLFAEIARKEDTHPVREAVFLPASSVLRTQPRRRRRGRQRQTWASELHRHAVKICGDLTASVDSLGAIPAKAWNAAVRQYCSCA